ncbi:MAG: hypothetical protein Q9178_002678 [Gyalolechia marmorata]
MEKTNNSPFKPTDKDLWLWVRDEKKTLTVKQKVVLDAPTACSLANCPEAVFASSERTTDHLPEAQSVISRDNEDIDDQEGRSHRLPKSQRASRSQVAGPATVRCDSASCQKVMKIVFAVVDRLPAFLLLGSSWNNFSDINRYIYLKVTRAMRAELVVAGDAIFAAAREALAGDAPQLVEKTKIRAIARNTVRNSDWVDKTSFRLAPRTGIPFSGNESQHLWHLRHHECLAGHLKSSTHSQSKTPQVDLQAVSIKLQEQHMISAVRGAGGQLAVEDQVAGDEGDISLSPISPLEAPRVIESERPWDKRSGGSAGAPRKIITYGLIGLLEFRAWNEIERTVIEWFKTHPHITDLRAAKDEIKELSQMLIDSYPHVFSELGRFAPSWFINNRTTAFINVVRCTKALKVKTEKESSEAVDFAAGYTI